MKTKVMMMAGLLAASASFGVAAGDKHEKDFIKSLNLNENKAEQVEDIMSRYHDQAGQIKDRAKDQISDLRDQKEEQLKTVLSDEEFDRYESLKDSKKEMKEEWMENCKKGKDGKWLGMGE
jgi:Spy/CpxP family protein refolding chaperone